MFSGVPRIDRYQGCLNEEGPSPITRSWVCLLRRHARDIVCVRRWPASRQILRDAFSQRAYEVHHEGEFTGTMKKSVEPKVGSGETIRDARASIAIAKRNVLRVHHQREGNTTSVITYLL